MGLIVLFSTVSGVAFVVIGLDSNYISNDRATVWIGILGIFATVGLAMGIYVQARQNQELVRYTDTQTAIAEESEWMPQVIQDVEKNRILFRRNRPWAVEIMLDIGVVKTGWIKHPVNKEPDNSSGSGEEWTMPLEIGEFIEVFDPVDPGEYTGELVLRFESITGSRYVYEYNVNIEVSENMGYSISASPEVIRQLPWKVNDLSG